MSRCEHYGYAVARLRAMDRRFVDAGVLQRMLDADDLNSALKILGETAYVAWMPEMKSDAAFDPVIEAELRHVYADVRTFVPDNQLLLLLQLPYDFHNVKVIFKSMVRQKRGLPRRWDLLTSLGSIPVDDMVTDIESEDFHLLPFGLPQVLASCFQIFEQTQDLLEVERRLDAALFVAMRKLAEAINFEGVTEWARARIDAENLRNVLRLKRVGRDAAVVAGFLHPGGRISPERCLDLLNEPVESWGRSLGFTDVSRVFGEVEGEGSAENELVLLERGLDDFVTAVLNRYTFESFAPEQVVRFLWRKEMEAKNVRVALVARANDMDRTMVRRLLRRV